MNKRILVVGVCLFATVALASFSTLGNAFRASGDSYFTNPDVGGALKVIDPDGLSINSGDGTTPIKGHFLTDVAMDAGSINNGVEGTVVGTVSGLLTTDHVNIMARCNLETGLLVKQAKPTASDQLTLTLLNLSGGTLDPVSCTYSVQFWR